jgi:small subunit ribosomal protein S4
MKIGPQYKLCRKLGSPIYEKCQTAKFQLNTEKKAKTVKLGRSSRSSFATQMIEKQKVRFSYGLTEKQFSSYVEKSMEKKGNPSQNLYLLLEHRLDNAIYRMGLALTRRAARQIVSHGHVLVNGRKMTIPSYQVKKDDIITIREKSQSSPLFTRVENEKGLSAINWVSFDPSKKEGRINGGAQFDPTLEQFDLTKVFEFYSR